MFIYKALSAVAAAAFGATIVLAIPGFSPEVEAGTPAPVASNIEIHPAAPTCTEQVWPYYTASCLHSGHPNTQPRAVRFVTADRVSR